MKSEKIMWVCENAESGVFADWTLARLRRDCVTKMWAESGLTWAQVKSYGWKPVKVKITIEKIEK